MQNTKTQSGFTLIELMISLVILGIIVMIALPAYTAQAERSRRADGTAALMLASMVMETCRSDLATYSGCAGRLDATSEEGYYTLALAVTGSGSGYTLTATPAGVQTNDDHCTSLTLNSQGTKGFAGNAGDASTCWGG